MTRAPASDEVQEILRQIIAFGNETTAGLGTDMGDGYWDMVIESYSSDQVRTVTDKKYGEGASNFIARALRYHFHG